MCIIITSATTSDQIEQLRAYVGDDPVDGALRGLRRIIPCDSCGGDGTHEAMPTGPHDSGKITKCDDCDGRGEIEIDVKPITLDDV